MFDTDYLYRSKKLRKVNDMKNYIVGSRYGQELADLRKSQGVLKSERNQLKKEEQIAKRTPTPRKSLGF